jgi:predicted thioesterase
MKHLYSPGDTLTFEHVVSEADTARFETESVHPVYSTFALGRDAEWSTRQFVLGMREADEEGIGTFLTIEHHAPALIGETVVFTARLESVEGRSVVCSYRAHVGERLIGSGRTGQKVLRRARLRTLFESLRKS